MHYLTVDKLSKSYADKPLFEGVSFHINEGDKVALVALNGTGKSTILKIITGEEIPDEGSVWIHKDVSVVMLSQSHEYNPDSTVADVIFQFDHPMMNAIRKYELLLTNVAATEAQLQDAINEIDSLNAWHFESKVKQVLDKLKVTKLDQPIGTMSGGEQKRISLAKVLIDLDFEHSHTLLILDEPTNHLDIEMIEWLEHYLTQDKMTIILVTHDRFFLDNVCNKIIEIANQKSYIINGKYEQYLEQKAIREEHEQASLEKAQNRYRKELEWMRKQPKARTTKSKARQENFYEWQQKATKRLEQAKLDLEVKMTRLGGKILELKKVNKQYGDKVILKGFDYTFKRGEKIGIVGKNGAGKSTFINIILGKEHADSGKINVGDTVLFGDFSQDGLAFKDNERVIEYVKNIAEYFLLADGTKVSAAQFLQKFLFTPEKQFSFIHKLSGGERKRLQLLSILFRNPNFLILDEPTNDLDLPTLDILEEFLIDFPGCIMIVSHDRYFMDKVVDHLFVFEGEGVVTDYPGNYSQYRQYKKEEEKALENKQLDDNNFTTEKDTAAEAPIKEKKKLSFKEKRDYEEITKQLPILEQKKADLEAQLLDASLDYVALEQISKEILALSEQIEDMELRWLALDELQGT